MRFPLTDGYIGTTIFNNLKERMQSPGTPRHPLLSELFDATGIPFTDELSENTILLGVGTRRPGDTVVMAVQFIQFYYDVQELSLEDIRENIDIHWNKGFDLLCHLEDSDVDEVIKTIVDEGDIERYGEDGISELTNILMEGEGEVSDEMILRVLVRSMETHYRISGVELPFRDQDDRYFQNTNLLNPKWDDLEEWKDEGSD